jgi:hypothetical protein
VWVGELTAWATLGAVIAAVGIAVWSDRRTTKRIEAEWKRTLEREQHAAAWAVRVDLYPYDPMHSMHNLFAQVTNGGSYPITDLELRFSPEGRSLVAPDSFSPEMPAWDSQATR